MIHDAPMLQQQHTPCNTTHSNTTENNKVGLHSSSNPRALPIHMGNGRATSEGVGEPAAWLCRWRRHSSARALPGHHRHGERRGGSRNLDINSFRASEGRHPACPRQRYSTYKHRACAAGPVLLDCLALCVSSACACMASRHKII